LRSPDAERKPHNAVRTDGCRAQRTIGSQCYAAESGLRHGRPAQPLDAPQHFGKKRLRQRHLFSYGMTLETDDHL
jgi:hypothetical protein